MRKDEFKNKCQIELTAHDLNCAKVYSPKWRGKVKRLFRRVARKRMKRENEIYER